MKKNIKKLILLLISFVFLYFVFVNLDIKELIHIIKRFNILYIPLLCLSIITSLSLRGLCFKQLISKTAKISLFDAALLCITGAALNVVLPARAGDIFRAYYFGQKYKIDKIKVFGTVMLERIFDIIVIFCLLCSGVFIYHENQIAMNLCILAGIILIAGVAFAIITYKYNKTDKICGFIEAKSRNLPFAELTKNLINFINKLCNSFFAGFEVIDSPKRTLYALFASFGIWFFECMNFLIVIYGFGYNIHWSVTIFIISFIALACMIPSTSIFIGPYQLAVITAFSIYNINKETALAISFVEQAIVTLTTAFIAFLFMLKNNISYKELKEDIEEEIEE